jgi:protein phosphatase
MTTPQLVTASLPIGPKPTDQELDLFGLTHPGRVRDENQDHFLIATLHRDLVIHGSSLRDTTELPLHGERIATLAVVADGVGGRAGGAEASHLTVETIARYVSTALACFQNATPALEDAFLDALRDGALQAHDTVRASAARHPQRQGMATTLTLVIGAWPRMYIVQVGDSRCYYYHRGQLRQLTRDQTVAQQLVDAGALRQSRMHESPFSHVLASAIGSGAAEPAVSRMQLSRDAVILLCTDGLTKHVSDDAITGVLRTIRSAEQGCHDLLQLALDGGGSDNITVAIRRTRERA